MFLSNKLDSFPNTRLTIARGTRRLLAPLNAYPGGRFALGQILAAIEGLEDHIEEKLPGKLTGAHKKRHEERHTRSEAGSSRNKSEDDPYHAKRRERYRRWLEEQDQQGLHADNSMSGALRNHSDAEVAKELRRPNYRDARYARRLAHNRKFHPGETDEQRCGRHARAREERRKRDRPGDREARALERRRRHHEERRVWEEERHRDEQFARARRPEPAFRAGLSDVDEEEREIGNPFILNFYSGGRVTRERGLDDGMEYGARNASPDTRSDGNNSPLSSAGEYSGQSGYEPLTGHLTDVEAEQRAATSSRSVRPLPDYAAKVHAWEERNREAAQSRIENRDESLAYGEDEQEYPETGYSQRDRAPGFQGPAQAEHLFPGGRGTPSAFQEFGAQHESEPTRGSERAPTRISPLQSVSGQNCSSERSYRNPDPNFDHRSSRSSYTGNLSPQSGIGQTPSSASVSERQSLNFVPGSARSSFTQQSRTTAIHDFGTQQVPESTHSSFVSGTRTPSIAQGSQRTSNTRGSTGQYSASSRGSYRPESTQQSYGRGVGCRRRLQGSQTLIASRKMSCP
ncbi:hypothetical protein LTS18_001047 [Coniosporium uncinatum]|uniref:Uncharacterized protein n=1 Tax=Coniosporium uncinatum TaxID=93489 RepID=A0ACC3D8E4_9PEZI|nr:hypothetical protein LTS18_001047 [Coniosporium uncinatum]